MHADDLATIRNFVERVGRGRILDAGCGPGHLTNFVASQGAEAFGVDLTPEFIDHARATYPGISFEVGSMMRLDNADASVDGILSWYSLIHVTNGQLLLALGELGRILVDDGLLLLGFFAGESTEKFPHKVIEATQWTLADMVEQVRQAGFSVVAKHSRLDSGHRPHAALLVRKAASPARRD